jgi:phosphate starvation-inducible protein PhoH
LSKSAQRFATKTARRKKTESQIFEDVVVPVKPQIKKTFTLKDLKYIDALTEHQSEAFSAFNSEKIQVLSMLGYAGTGKTFLAMYMALKEVLDPETPYEKIVILRSVVPSREIGFLPGEMEDKIAPYEAPYRAICDKLFKFRNSYDNLKELGKIEFECTSFLRGNTFDNAIIIVDEIQNATEVEGETCITRIGDETRMIICGDDIQNDLGNKSGFMHIIPILRRTPGTYFIDFGLDDIVRSGFVKAYLTAKYGRAK